MCNIQPILLSVTQHCAGMHGRLLGKHAAGTALSNRCSDNAQVLLDAPRPAFQLLSIYDIIPDEKRDLYAAAGGDVL